MVKPPVLQPEWTGDLRSSEIIWDHLSTSSLDNDEIIWNICVFFNRLFPRSTSQQVVTCRQRDEPHLSDREHHGQKFILAFFRRFNSCWLMLIMLYFLTKLRLVRQDNNFNNFWRKTAGKYGKSKKIQENACVSSCFIFLQSSQSSSKDLRLARRLGSAIVDRHWTPCRVHVLWTCPEDDAKGSTVTVLYHANPFGYKFCTKQGSLNVPIEHHPTIGDIISNRYLKVMSNIPKMGHLPTPAKCPNFKGFWMVLRSISAFDRARASRSRAPASAFQKTAIRCNSASTQPVWVLFKII